MCSKLQFKLYFLAKCKKCHVLRLKLACRTSLSLRRRTYRLHKAKLLIKLSLDDFLQFQIQQIKAKLLLMEHWSIKSFFKSCLLNATNFLKLWRFKTLYFHLVPIIWSLNQVPLEWVTLEPMLLIFCLLYQLEFCQDS